MKKKARFRVNGVQSMQMEEHLILSTGKPLTSCLKGSRLVSKDSRQDRTGNAIVKASKYKLTYVDKVQKGEPLA